jgi:hypothetical protein
VVVHLAELPVAPTVVPHLKPLTAANIATAKVGFTRCTVSQACSSIVTARACNSTIMFRARADRTM